MIFIMVDLPAPFSPTSPWISPSLSEKSTSRSAWTPPKDFDTPIISSRARRASRPSPRASRILGDLAQLSVNAPADQIRKFFCSQRLPGAVSSVMTGPSAQM